MKITSTLYISDEGKLRLTKGNFYPNTNEIAVRLNIEVPNNFFKRPTPILDLQIPDDFVVNPDAEIVASFTASQIAGALKLDATEVTDGLVAMMKKKAQFDLPEEPETHE